MDHAHSWLPGHNESVGHILGVYVQRILHLNGTRFKNLGSGVLHPFRWGAASAPKIDHLATVPNLVTVAIVVGVCRVLALTSLGCVVGLTTTNHPLDLTCYRVKFSCSVAL